MLGDRSTEIWIILLAFDDRERHVAGPAKFDVSLHSGFETFHVQHHSLHTLKLSLVARNIGIVLPIILVAPPVRLNAADDA